MNAGVAGGLLCSTTIRRGYHLTRHKQNHLWHHYQSRSLAHRLAWLIPPQFNVNGLS